MAKKIKNNLKNLVDWLNELFVLQCPGDNIIFCVSDNYETTDLMNMVISLACKNNEDIELIPISNRLSVFKVIRGYYKFNINYINQIRNLSSFSIWETKKIYASGELLKYEISRYDKEGIGCSIEVAPDGRFGFFPRGKYKKKEKRYLTNLKRCFGNPIYSTKDKYENCNNK